MISIPNHIELGLRILRALIWQTGMMVEEFLELLDQG